jgi:hypothetical protein
MLSSLVVMAAAARLHQPACAPLKTLSLPRATITAVALVAAGGQAPGRGLGGAAAALPAHCRVAVTLTPVAFDADYQPKPALHAIIDAVTRAKG